MARHAVPAVPVSRLAAASGARTTGDPATIVTGLTQDSRDVAPGDMYCAVRGANFDGRAFVADAVARGAAAVLVDDASVDGHGAVTLLVDDVRASLGPVAAEAFGHPAGSLTMVGVTGTNGKTSVAWMVGSIMRAAGHSVEVRGTLTGERTTQEAIDLQAGLAAAVAAGVDCVVMEVSSHSLVMHRVDGFIFDVAVFTNLGRDHMDFHGNDESYFAAKAILFEPEHCVVGLANVDDVHGRLLVDSHAGRVVGFSSSDATGVVSGVDSSTFSWRGAEIVLPMGGGFSVANAVAAATAAAVLGVDVRDIVQGLAGMKPVPGRFEPVPNGLGIGVIVDYAHTPDALRALLAAARPMTKGRLIVVFGCGGDRDKGKRPLMGCAAAESADVVIVTSDNPRSEDPVSIIDEIVAGIPAGSALVSVHVDRAEAVVSAISTAEHGDIVVIAGKGHESTQEVSGEFLPFSDAEVARVAIARIEEEQS